MNTLTEICMQNITEQISEAPPMIQEMIIEETKKSMKEKIIVEFQNEIKILKEIVPYITKSIILSRSTFVEKPDFYILYKKVPKYILELAIEIAEKNICELNTSFNILTMVSSMNNLRYRFYVSTSEDEQENEEREYESEEREYELEYESEE